MKHCKELAARRVRAITTEECTRYIEQAFATPRQRQKARLILSGVFSTALKRGWCSENPVARVDAVKVREERIEILTPQEIKAFLSAAKKYRGGICSCAPIALMRKSARRNGHATGVPCAA